jgi:hypothetical protein
MTVCRGVIVGHLMPLLEGIRHKRDAFHNTGRCEGIDSDSAKKFVGFRFRVKLPSLIGGLTSNGMLWG